ncbi:LVIVD repeat-containing protein [Granulicella tundricola]|uniref:Putative secreted protein n=1 Tax=Granulicella tundricola (strain ATCC BAA-1859 / DSM 23138 / MP5ACTX9) TaxID=1198114 RepID=E8WWT7_GRATM|nr:hypothetical protein [Granulicella tundricola]ADW67415.1 putative secreted protein [Granulicella tundricola MP5ACTX9]
MTSGRGFRFTVGAVAFALSTFTPVLCSGQSAAMAAPAAPHATAPSFVYSNPRTGSDDPRVGLKGGLYDAQEAILGMQRLVSLPKPAGFEPDVAAIKAADATPPPAPPAPGAPRVRGARGPSYGGTNSDIAFGATHLFVGNYNGVNFYDISNPAQTKLITSVVCPGGQGDVSVYGHLLFMSVEAANGRLDCGTQGMPTAPPPTPEQEAAMMAPPVAGAPRPARPQDPASHDREKGVRIFDISDIKNPKQVADVQTCRGSHTHTLLVDPKDKDNIYVYVSGSAGVRPAEELGGCTGGDPNIDPDTALFTIVVIKVPLAHPELAKVVSSPRIFSDPETGKMDALWKGGNHGEGTQTTSATRGCHDITVYSAIGLAAGACSGNGILLDIKDPVHPKRIDAVTDPNYAFWHSANFSNDGTKVMFTDEWGGGGQPRCRESDPMNWGADAIFRISKDDKLQLASYYKMPAPQTEKENCVAHNGSMIPIPGRDIEVQSWYQGGISIMDYTDASHPFEIGYFDRGPVDDSRPAMGGQWSTYYYNGYIYGSEIARGVDVFKLVPSKYITQAEIDAAAQVNLPELNVQNQPKIVWPSTAVTARAYVDQLARDNSLTAAQVSSINAELAKSKSAKLKAMAKGLDKDAATAKTPKDAERMHELAKIMSQSGM